jgi:hypothetical protein
MFIKLLLLAMSGAHGAIRGSVRSTNEQVNERTTLEFNLDQWEPSGTLAQGSVIQITFPDKQFANFFSSFGEGAILPTTLCQPEYGFGATDGLECRVEAAAKRVAVKLGERSELEELGFVIRDVINPGSVPDEQNFIIRILNPDGISVIDSTENAGSSIFRVGVKPGELRSVNLVNSNKVVGQYGQLTVSIVTNQQNSRGGHIMMKFPSWAEELGHVSYFNDHACLLVFDARSNLSPSASCTIFEEASHDIVMIQNAVDEFFNGGTISFVMDQVRNAPSTRGVEGIEVNTFSRES